LDSHCLVERRVVVDTHTLDIKFPKHR
jgi:hypothetical protein